MLTPGGRLQHKPYIQDIKDIGQTKNFEYTSDKMFNLGSSYRADECSSVHFSDEFGFN